MSHRNAPLTETGRLRLARCVVEQEWSYRRAAERFQVAPTTAKRWADRYRQHGPAGMADRSSRPRRSPARTARHLERRIVRLRWRRRWGPARIAGCLGLPASTVGAVLRRYRAPRLAHLDRATSGPVRRYEHPAPGELVHVDIKKLGNIPDGGGHRIVGRSAGNRNKQRTPSTLRRDGKPVIGSSYLHTALDDHTRLAYTEILPNERKDTAAAFWARATTWFATHGIDRIHRVLTDNGSCYRSHTWRDALAATNTRHKRTRPFRPQTNGKVERYHRTLLDEWAYARPYTSEPQRRAALPTFLHWYNHHRHHTAIGGPPTTRVTNLSGQYI